MKHVKCMRHIVICGLTHSTILSTLLLNDTIFAVKTIIEREICVAIFIHFFLNIFHSTKNRARYYLNVHMSSHKVPLFLADFNKIWIPSTDFRNILKYQVCIKSFQTEPSFCNRTDRRKWRTGQSLLATFRRRLKSIKQTHFKLISFVITIRNLISVYPIIPHAPQ